MTEAHPSILINNKPRPSPLFVPSQDGMNKPTSPAPRSTTLAKSRPSMLMINSPVTQKKNALTFFDSVVAFKDRLKEVLVKSDRNDEEARILHSALKDYAFFKRFGEDNDDLEAEGMVYLCKNLKYEFHPAGTVIFEQDDPSNGKMYICYSGQLSIVLKQNDVISQQNLAYKLAESPSKSPKTPRKSLLGTSKFKDQSIPGTPTMKLQRRDSFALNSPAIKKNSFLAVPSGSPTKESETPRLRKSSSILSIEDTPKRTKSRFAPSGENTPLGNETVRKVADKFLAKFKHSDPVSAHSRSEISSIKDEATPSSVSSAHKLTKQKSRFSEDPSPRHDDQNPLDFKSTGIITPVSIDGSSQVNTPLLANKSERARKDSKDSSIIAMQFMSKIIGKTRARKNSVCETPSEIMSQYASNKYGSVVDTVEKGGFFGEKAIYDNQKRGATVIANTDVELLVVTREVFDFVKANFDKKKNRVLQFMEKTIPKIETINSRKVLENLFYLLEEETFYHGNNIIKEGDASEKFYILFDGECEIIKSVNVDLEKSFKYPISEISDLVRVGHHRKENLILSTIQPGMFFGEEILYRKPPRYQFTVRVSSLKATVFSLNKAKFSFRFPRACYYGLREVFNEKSKTHAERIKQLLTVKYKDIEIDTSDIFKPDEDAEIEILEGPVEFKSTGAIPKPYKDNFKQKKATTFQLSKEMLDKYHLNDEEEQDFKARTSPTPRILAKRSSESTIKRVEELKEIFRPLTRTEVLPSRHSRTISEQVLTPKASLTRPQTVVEKAISPRPKIPKLKSSSTLLNTPRDLSAKNIPTSPVASNLRARQGSMGEPLKPIKELAWLDEKDTNTFLTSVGLEERDKLNFSTSPKALSRQKSFSVREKAIRSDSLPQVKTWNEFYENIMKIDTFRELQEEASKPVDKSNINKYKLDLGRTEPLVDLRYRAIKFKMGLISFGKKGYDGKQTDQFTNLKSKALTSRKKISIETDELSKNLASLVKSFTPTPKPESVGFKTPQEATPLTSKFGSPVSEGKTILRMYKHITNTSTDATDMTSSVRAVPDLISRRQSAQTSSEASYRTINVEKLIKELKKDGASIQEQMVKKKHQIQLKLKKRVQSRQNSLANINNVWVNALQKTPYTLETPHSRDN